MGKLSQKRAMLTVLTCFFIFFAFIKVFAQEATNTQEIPPIGISNEPLKLWVPYDSKNPDSLNNLREDSVFINSDDLKLIQNSKSPAKIYSGEPPVSYYTSSVSYNSAIKDNYASISAVYNIQKFNNEWILIPVISGKAGISSVFLDNKPAVLISGQGQNLSGYTNGANISPEFYYLALRDKGNHNLKLNFTVNINKDSSTNTKSFAFTQPDIPAVSLNCFINQKNIDFNVSDATSVSTKIINNGTQLIASIPPLQNIEVKWTPKSFVSVDNKIGNKLSVPASVIATTYSNIQLGRGSLNGTLTADLDIRNSALDHFDFYVPDGIDIDSVSADNNVELINNSPSVKNNILPVDLNSAVEGNLKLHINFRKNFNSPSFITKIPAITLINNNLERETGYVGISEITNIETSVSQADETKNWQNIDSSELTGPLSGMNTSIAFKYLKNKNNLTTSPYDITINVKRHENISVYEANIKSVNITSILNDDGHVFTKAIYELTNTKKQFLDIKIPNHSSIWSVYVDGKPAKPAIKDEKNNLYSIPLSKSSVSEEGGKAFTMEIVYSSDKAFILPPWLFGITNLKAVSTELPSNYTSWKIYFPTGSKIFPTVFSNLNKKEFSDEPHTQLIQVYDSLNTLGGQTNKAIVSSLEESDGSLSKGNYEFRGEVSGYEKQKDETQIFSPSRQAGKLPVYINLPKIGNPYLFEQISFRANQHPSINVLYINNCLFALLLVIALAFLIRQITVLCREKLFKSLKFIMFSALALLILYSLIGLYLLLIGVITCLVILHKKQFYKKITRKHKIIAGISVFIILLMFKPQLAMLIAIPAILIFLLIRIFKFIKNKWFIKQKLKDSVNEIVNDLHSDTEGQTNE